MNAAKLLITGLEHHRAGRLEQAEAIYHAMLSVDADDPDALQYQGIVLSQRGRPDEGVALLQRSVAIRPTPEAHLNLGLTLRQAGRTDESIPEFRSAVAMVPQMLQALSALGMALKDTGDLAGAIECCKRIIELAPNLPEGHANLGIALAEDGRFDAAIPSLWRAVEIDPNNFYVLNVLGCALNTVGQIGDAAICHERAIRLHPDRFAPYANLANELLEEGRVQEAVAMCEQALRLAPNEPLAQSNLLLTLNYLPGISQSELFARHAEFGRRFTDGTRIAPHPNDPDPDRRLRIGYHIQFWPGNPAGYFLERILAQQDHAKFEIIFYNDFRRVDVTSERFNGYADQLRDISNLNDEQAAEMVRRDRVDILVDLAGHIGKNRMMLFARKPAPVQVTYIGYCNTTGLPTMDYLITDTIVDPPGVDGGYVEKLIRLPGGFCCYAPPANAPDVGALPSASAGRVTFGSLHTLAKLNDDVIDLWCQLLRVMSNTRLLIVRHTMQGRTRDRFAALFRDRGFGDDRVELRSATPGDHWHIYHEVDISLDVFPWSGHTTACESLWMGVPIITLLGQTHAGRMVASVLTSLGLTELIADTPEAYIATAARLAADPRALDQYRQTLRPRMVESELCLGRSTVKEVEEAYRRIWRDWSTPQRKMSK